MQPPALVSGENYHGKMLLDSLLLQKENIYRMVIQNLHFAGDDVTTQWRIIFIYSGIVWQSNYTG